MIIFLINIFEPIISMVISTNSLITGVFLIGNKTIKKIIKINAKRTDNKGRKKFFLKG